MGKKSGYGSGMNNPDHISENLETIFWVKVIKFFDADPESGMEKFGSGITDGKNSDPGSATLPKDTTDPEPEPWYVHIILH
jgi:hypothetical protein